MLIDKHEADNILKRIPGLTIKMSPELAAIDQVLDDDELFCMIRDDLAQRYPKSLTADRKSTPVEVILRMLAIKHLYNLSYEQTVFQVADSVRVLGRTLTRAKTLLVSKTDLSKETFRNRQRSANRTARKIAGLSRSGREQLKPHYQRLLQTTRATVLATSAIPCRRRRPYQRHQA